MELTSSADDLKSKLEQALSEAATEKEKHNKEVAELRKINEHLSEAISNFKQELHSKEADLARAAESMERLSRLEHELEHTKNIVHDFKVELSNKFPSPNT